MNNTFSVYTKNDYFNAHIFGQNYISPIESISQTFFTKGNLFSEANEVYKKLGFNNIAVLEIAYDIIKECSSNQKADITISYTGENEFLIYRVEDGEYRNIIIDKEADIEYLLIPIDRRKTTNEYYSFVMGFGIDFIKNLVAKL